MRKQGRERAVKKVEEKERERGRERKKGEKRKRKIYYLQVKNAMLHNFNSYY